MLVLSLTFFFKVWSRKHLLWADFGPETQNYFLLNDIPQILVFKSVDSEFNNCFLNSDPSISFPGKFGPEASKCVVLNETRSIGVLKGFDSEFGNCFF